MHQASLCQDTVATRQIQLRLDPQQRGTIGTLEELLHGHRIWDEGRGSGEIVWRSKCVYLP